jgi:hypothetical protein
MPKPDKDNIKTYRQKCPIKFLKIESKNVKKKIIYYSQLGFILAFKVSSMFKKQPM